MKFSVRALASVLIVCAGLAVTGARAAGDDQLGQPPASCDELDQALAHDGPLAQFVVKGAAQVRTATNGLDAEHACQLLRDRSGYASGLIGILSYCDSQQVLRAGAPNNVLYRRVGDAVRQVGNDLDDLMREHRC